MDDDRKKRWSFNHHLPSNPPLSSTSSTQTTDHPPFLSPPYTQSLENQLSHLSLLGSGSASLNPNLPRTVNNNNNNLDNLQHPSYPHPRTPFDLDTFRPYYAGASTQIPASFLAAFSSSSSSSSSNQPNLNNYYGSGSGSGAGSGAGYNYNDMNHSSILLRNGFTGFNGFRSSLSDDLELRRSYLEHISNVVNNLLCNGYMNDHNHHNHSYSSNSINYNNNKKRMVRSRGYNSNYRSGSGVVTTPVNLFYDPTSWEEIKGRVVDYVKDKSLSQLLIRKFESGKMEGIKMVVSEIKEGISEVLFNANGSQFFQKLLDFLDQQDIVELLKGVMANQREFVDICFDCHGTRAVQKLLQTVDANNREVRMVVLNAIRGVGVTLTKNLNSYHVFDELLKAFQQASEVIFPLLGEIADHTVNIAVDKSGCCALQNCIEHGRGPERDRIIYEIIAHAAELSEDAYGNYVVQYVVGMKTDPHARVEVFRILMGKFVYLSKSKFGSHVVEKCLKEADDEHFNLIIGEIIEDPRVFLEIVQHPMGNFVAQTALERSQVRA
ncbi:pumilio homolog 12 [Beta vulgaris subsp. vulgaris]|uniref:pumilio homolog 12 n=1 Tax=Beta vulgaris subsp. vulgaris TaxID=3555 RepID=UPI002036ED15|nr:pumilio homolog 12 [Beta vulgaris subsp. vulgaris]